MVNAIRNGARKSLSIQYLTDGQRARTFDPFDRDSPG